MAKPWRVADYIDHLPAVKSPAERTPEVIDIESMNPDEPEFQLEDFTRTEHILVALFAGILLLVAVVVGLAMFGNPSPVVSN